MWPWGHLAVGYLLYSAISHLRGRTPTGPPVVALAVGTQFPDLVDKPLAWTFGVIPNGRSLAHSVFTLLVVVAVVELVARRRRYGAVATAFSLGYASHLFADALYPALAGRYDMLAFLVWPVLPAIDYGTGGFAAHLSELSVHTLFTPQVGLALLILVLWFYDGRPGIGVVVEIPRWVGRKLSA